MADATAARRPQLAELGMFLLVVALPLAFTPFSASPFGDPKLVIVMAGTLALWAGGLPADRKLGALAAVWVAVTAVASLAGVEPIRSLTARTEGQGGGLVLTLCCATLVVVGSAIPEELRGRARRWLTISGAIVGASGILLRVAPDVVPDRIGGTSLTFIGSTMGNQLFAAAFVATGVAAAITSSRPLGRKLLLVGFLALGAASFGERSSLVLPLVATAATLWRGRLGWREGSAIATLVVAVLLGWQVVEPSLPQGQKKAGAALAPLQGQATDEARQVVWRATARGIGHRPLLGWGPGASDAAYLANATPDEVVAARRAWADAHNLFLETAVTTGVLGLIALIALMSVVLIRAVRCPPDRAWTFGAAAALGAYALVEPLNLVLTPLLFLFAGMAAGRREGVGVQTPAPEVQSQAPGVQTPALARIAVGVLLAAGLVVSTMMLAGATFERWGRVYGEQWALRAATRVQPWRLSATQRLALDLALDGRAGDPEAGERAQAMMNTAVQRFPWDVDVRLWAADVDILLNDRDAAQVWLDEQIARFPADAALLESADPGDGFTNPGAADQAGGG
jgi:O-antigen ligase